MVSRGFGQVVVGFLLLEGAVKTMDGDCDAGGVLSGDGEELPFA